MIESVMNAPLFVSQIPWKSVIKERPTNQQHGREHVSVDFEINDFLSYEMIHLYTLTLVLLRGGRFWQLKRLYVIYSYSITHVFTNMHQNLGVSYG